MKKCCLPSVAAISELTGLSPGALIEARAAAFGRGDFGLIYDSYHSEAPFLQHFPDRAAYLVYGRQTLATDFMIHRCTVLQVKIESDSASVLFYLDSSFRAQREETIELCRLLLTATGWRYHSCLKLPRQQFPGALQAISIDIFDREYAPIRF